VTRAVMDAHGGISMSVTNEFSGIMVGDEVFGSDGDKLGTVAEIAPDYITVEKGFFFPTDYFIPRSAVQTMQNSQVFLNVSKDVALNSGWDQLSDIDVSATTDQVLAQRQAGMSAESAGWTSQTVEGEEIRIPLAEEELTATVRPTEAGAVRVQKTVVAEDRVLDVPVTEEHIRVERRVVDRAVEGVEPDAFEDMVIEVPLTEEKVDVKKRARVKEEVVISKQAVEHTEHVADTVRHEEIYIDEEPRVGGVNP
jgi:uncharacterized protein (TIGR02271 family)